MAATFFKLFPAEYSNHDYQRKLSLEEAGIVFRVCIIGMWNDGGKLPDDDEYIASIARVPVDVWKTCKTNLLETGIITKTPDGSLTHKDMIKKYIHAENYSKTQSKNSIAKQMKYDKKVADELAELTRKPQPIY